MGASELPPLDAKRLILNTLPPRQQFEQWRARMDHMIDVAPNGQSVAQGFDADITVYQVGEVVISRCLSDGVVLQRSLARISTDNVRDYMFQIFLDGDAGEFDRPGLSLQACRGDIVVQDFNEPLTMRRGRYDSLNLFVPRPMVDAWLPAGADLHCARAPGASPLAAIARDSILSFLRHLPGLTPVEALSALTPLLQLLVAAVSAPVNPALTREVTANLLADAALAPARQYIEAHLDDTDLDAAVIARHLGVSRSHLYRLFQRYGGVSAYILRIRLRHAAAELVRSPSRAITEIAYGLGFSSPSDFSRAFRRFYGYSPSEVRLQLVQGAAPPSGTLRNRGQSGRSNRPYSNWLGTSDPPVREA